MKAKVSDILGKRVSDGKRIGVLSDESVYVRRTCASENRMEKKLEGVDFDWL